MQDYFYMSTLPDLAVGLLNTQQMILGHQATVMYWQIFIKKYREMYFQDPLLPFYFFLNNDNSLAETWRKLWKNTHQAVNAGGEKIKVLSWVWNSSLLFSYVGIMNYCFFSLLVNYLLNTISSQSPGSVHVLLGSVRYCTAYT